MSKNFLTYGLLVGLFGVMQACGSTTKATVPQASAEDRIAALQVLNQTIKPTANSTTTTSTDIDWIAGVLPWDRFTLPVISPNGLHAAVQLGKPPKISSLCGNDDSVIESTTIELHILDPIQGRRISPLHIGRDGLILSPAADDHGVLVEVPKEDGTRSIGKIEWATGNLNWLADDEHVNAFPTINSTHELVWSRKVANENRFYLVLQTLRGQRTIDDGISDWILPKFLGNDRLRVFKIKDGSLSLVELDLRARDPLLTAITLPIVDEGGTRKLAWQISSTTQTHYWHRTHAFYHPVLHRMVLWKPNQSEELIALVPGSISATPATDNTWLVATDHRIVRQREGDAEGIYLRNKLAIPMATTSDQWTHLLLIPQGNRLQVHAINLDD